ncbi:hypothetical protein BC567DRAFT_223117 [Phyllosticta citribraziliensis]
MVLVLGTVLRRILLSCFAGIVRTAIRLVLFVCSLDNGIMYNLEGRVEMELAVLDLAGKR